MHTTVTANRPFTHNRVRTKPGALQTTGKIVEIPHFQHGVTVGHTLDPPPF